MLTFSKIPINYPKLTNILFLFGSVGLVLVNSVALNTELILNAGIGDRLLGDLRIVVFPSECVFTIPLLILPIFTPWTPVRSESKTLPESDGTPAEAGNNDEEQEEFT